MKPLKRLAPVTRASNRQATSCTLQTSPKSLYMPVTSNSRPSPVVLALVLLCACTTSRNAVVDTGCDRGIRDDSAVVLPSPNVKAGYVWGLPRTVTCDTGRFYSSMDAMELVVIPGSPPILMDRHEVSVSQYRRYCSETGRTFPNDGLERNPRWPMSSVTFEEASQYLEWAGRRLPTEAEWLQAARGPNGERVYPWGDLSPAKVKDIFLILEHGSPNEIASHPLDCTPEGCFDLGGSVQEWTSSSADARFWLPDHAPPDMDQQRIIRGWCRYEDEEPGVKPYTISDSRPGLPHFTRALALGFRGCVSLPDGR